MRGDFSRSTFGPATRYAGVYLQQGRVQLDADVNEQADVDRESARRLMTDLVGPFGGPERHCGFGVRREPSGDLWLDPGRYYVDGVACAIGAPVRYRDQPFQPALPKPGPGPSLLWLDVWHRVVTAAEDPGLAEPALGGADTSVRLAVAWRVAATAWDGPLDAGAVAIAWPAGTGEQAPCGEGSLAVGGAYAGAENQLWRVEVASPGPAGEATFTWSRDNGSRGYALAAPRRGRRMTLITTDSRPLPAGTLVELVDRRTERPGRPCAAPVLATVAATGGDASVTDVTLDALASDAPGRDLDARPQLRPWDNHLSMAPTVELADGITVHFDPEAGYRSGDWWAFRVRAAAGRALWPCDGDGRPAPERPHGVVHRLAPLALVAGRQVIDCRSVFSPLARPAG